ncbi:MAG: hypothetical protein ACTSQJ_11290 [Promethearchaeota archaeon]
MDFIEPSFKIDNKGRVICKAHSNYYDFVKPNRDFFEDMLLDSQLTCKTCAHYENNTCAFPKSEIDKIEKERLKKEFYCRLCGSKIHRMFTIVQKIYLKETYNVELPLICCNCYEKLENNEFFSEAKRRIYFSFYTLVVMLFFTFILVIIIKFDYFADLLIILSLLFVIITLVIWTTYVILDLFKLKKRVSGILYYKKYFEKKLS